MSAPRVVALSGLLAARVLGVRLHPWSDGTSLEQLYDEIMQASGRRPEFSKDP